ncbi:multidrug effflux MFS transporter [Cognatishimia sp. MH4019]|uniref:multidrug effflux MFS transporter n=1 Tax=Cognatishimia sp. MH4019 TaxID=2854030 RepID=UPI001CD31EA9|nr:multidrug effflux MFS transporter [Cognatishimia sp. MH4019]
MTTPGRAEFIALMAMISATVAFSIDAMLPALPEIAAELTPDAPEGATLIITSFVFGMGLGTLFAGPLSDALGRRPVIFAGFALYCVGAVLAVLANTLELVLAARVIQGLGVAGPRIVALAVIRDLFSGREMARLMSFVLLVFSLVPAIAPALGAVIIWGVGWRGIFGAFVIFSLLIGSWYATRMPETLPAEARRPIRVTLLWSALVEMLSIPMVRLSMLTQALCFGMLFAVLSTTQQMFDLVFDKGASFPLWFGLIALLAATASIVNARFVMRLGMRKLVMTVLGTQILISSASLISFNMIENEAHLFPIFLFWITSLFFLAGMTLGNLNALAMEPVGHIAGMAASLMGSVSTIGAVFVAVPIGLAFTGSPIPVAIGTLTCSILAFLLTLRMRQLERVVVTG